ncbi:MAG: putative phage tail protein [Oscillospiraceae bacterium]
MLREVNLIQHLPQYMQSFKEIQAIMSAENPEVQTLENETEVIKNNQFIVSCDATGISKFENILHIIPSSADTLEARVSRVLARWNDSIPYTYQNLINKLDSFCGKGNYTLVLKPDLYRIEITARLPLSGQVQELEKLCANIIPANLEVVISNALSFEALGTVYTASTLIDITSM